jgi:hydroxymethylpyrimidine/phosphomethylpyrimidine kinase
MVLTALSSLHNSLVARLSPNEAKMIEALTATIAEELRFELAKTKALMDKINTGTWS